MLDLTRPHDAHIDRRLRTEPVIWLGTTRPDGRPHLVPVWFLWDGASILILSLPGTQKLRNLRHEPRVTLALEAADRGYDIVIVEGRAALLDDPGLRGTLPAFVAKYAGMPRRWSAEEWAEKFTQPIRVTPSRLVSWMTHPAAPPQRRVIRF